VHVIAFLDPKCADSKSYNNRIYPMIKEKYIDTNKILYTVIPVSFIPDSTPASVALLCAYNQDPKSPNPELFMKYLNYLYEHQPPEHTDWTTTATLVSFAKKASPAIDIKNIEGCINKQEYRHQIAKNTEYEEILIGHPQAPVLFIDGMRLEQVSAKNIQKLMKAAFLEKGVTL
ncbi:MAG: thioredoxin domain-containing protein, partial [Simkaniaceae bacterium]|nr:thioredoxin domain-containing protein [Simkaniaceae bacterium]